ncbi:MAG: ROK family protein [Ignavibacteriaceae bacterium]|nr:ROK family protein [Ignavibacteriaceae bacterium]
MNYQQDERIILTLDAGGTNFVFSAMRGLKEIVAPISQPAYADDLDKCLSSIINGFTKVKSLVSPKPSAISFAFPGPADYPSGIIGDLGNLPAFKGGVPLGPIIEDKFNIPVFINNDGNLFAYGEAIAGFLLLVNNALSKNKFARRYKNLLGITLGTGLGAGIVISNELLVGDNSNGAEIWLMRNKINSSQNVEETVSIRGLKKLYLDNCSYNHEIAPEPEQIYQIALGEFPGDREAAIDAFNKFGEAAGDAIAQAITLVDGLIVVGGGISGAYSLFINSLIKEMTGKYLLNTGDEINRLDIKVYNWEDEKKRNEFLSFNPSEINLNKSGSTILYYKEKKSAIGLSKLGTSKAIAVGAYAFAVNELNKNKL